MHRLVSLTCIFALVPIPVSTAQAQVQGIAPIRLENAERKCVNIKKHAVSMIITSVKVAKKDTLFKKIRGAGGKSEVQLVSSDHSKTYSYPAEAALNVQDLRDGIISAPIRMSVLSQYTFAADNSFTELQLPFYLLEREGKSDIAKYSRALIKFTQENGSALPLPGLATAAGLVKQLSDGFFSQLDGATSSEVSDPDFRVSYQLSGSDSCPSMQFLHSGTFAQIRDTKLKGEGTVKTSEQDDYCFYLYDTTADDPRIGYVKREGTCSSTRPANLQPLNNPQLVYVIAAWDKATTAKIANTVALFSGGRSAFAGVEAGAAVLSLLQANPTLPRDEVLNLATICDLARLKAEECVPGMVASKTP